MGNMLYFISEITTGQNFLSFSTTRYGWLDGVIWDYYTFISRSEHRRSIIVLLGQGNGSFLKYSNYSLTNRSSYVAAVADFNRDSVLDIVIPHYYGNAISVLADSGNGAFGRLVSLTSGYTPAIAIVGDFNRDNRIDFAVANYGSSTAGIYLNTCA
ncbi:unnamed protein product [Rotaria socialis]